MSDRDSTKDSVVPGGESEGELWEEGKTRGNIEWMGIR